MTEQIDHPNHYNNHPSGVECIEIVEHMPYNIGNAVAYLWRYQDKHEDPTLDLKKAMWHIQREIEKIENARLRQTNATIFADNYLHPMDDFFLHNFMHMHRYSGNKPIF